MKSIGWKLVFVPTYEGDKIIALDAGIMKLSYDSDKVMDECEEDHSDIVEGGYNKSYLLINEIYIEEIYDMDMNVINPVKCLPVTRIFDLEYYKHKTIVEYKHGLYVFRTKSEVYEFHKFAVMVFNWAKKNLDGYLSAMNYVFNTNK